MSRIHNIINLIWEHTIISSDKHELYSVIQFLKSEEYDMAPLYQCFSIGYTMEKEGLAI